ncbi:MAG: S8 family peptidase [Actinobacteria bacterium]|nr:S8 family peptidase [Actinomycetota bacterium]
MVAHRARRRWFAGLATAAVVLAGALFAIPATAQAAPAPLSPSLVQELSDPSTAGAVPVLVHGATLTDAQHAVDATGMQRVTIYRKIGVVAARASRDQVEAARTQPGVTYLEGNQPISFTSATANVATRNLEARQTLVGANGAPLDGSGVSIAVIDTGIDPTHPAFTGGKVVRSLKSLCLDETSTQTSCVTAVPTIVDTDTLSLGGHGTHVSSIAAGNAVTLTDGTPVSGAAPGAKVVALSTGAAVLILGPDAALNWVLENHRAPCGAGVSVTQCPPIKVVNNSYGPSGGGVFDPNSATAKLQRQLAGEGVVTVWAAGNEGGDGSTSLTNPPGQDPTGGVISVASYNDEGTGTRTGPVSSYSSRGAVSDPSSWPDISAPGENIVGACRPYLPVCTSGLQPQNGPSLLDVGTYNSISGSSMAAPHLAGIVAQLFQAAPTATPAEVEHALKSTAFAYPDGAPYQSLGGYSTSFDKGTGLVDVVAAATALGAPPS